MYRAGHLQGRGVPGKRVAVGKGAHTGHQGGMKTPASRLPRTPSRRNCSALGRALYVATSFSRHHRPARATSRASRRDIPTPAFPDKPRCAADDASVGLVVKMKHACRALWGLWEHSTVGGAPIWRRTALAQLPLLPRVLTFSEDSGSPLELGGKADFHAAPFWFCLSMLFSCFPSKSDTYARRPGIHIYTLLRNHHPS